MEEKRMTGKRKATKAMAALLLAAAAVATAKPAPTGAEAQTPPRQRAEATMAEVWKAMPDSLLPYLTHNDRLDMVDYIDAKMKAEVTNRMDGKSTLDTLSTDYLHLTLNEAVTVEMGLLPTDGLTADSCAHVVCVITTYGSPEIESRIKFYTANWNEWRPTPPISPERLMPTADAYSYPTATFGASPREIVLSLSKIAGENDEKQAAHFEKSIKWDGKTFKID